MEGKAVKRIAIVASLFLLLNVGCQKSNKDDALTVFTQPVYNWGEITGETLTVWGSMDLNREYIYKAFQRYEELTHNTLEIVQIEKNDIDKQLLSAIHGDIKMPDIFVSYGGTNIDAFSPNENFYDFSEAEWVNDLTTTSINQTVYNGEIIGLPLWEASISGTIYNKTLFNKYGIEIPQNQAEFMEACDTLLKNGITPMYLPAKEISMLLYQFPLDTLVENSEILNKLNHNEIGYEDIEGFEDILIWYKTMADKGYFGSDYMNYDWNGMSPAMESGNYAMMLCWDTWLYSDYKGDPSEFGLMPAFMGIPDQGVFEGPNLNLFMVNKKSENLDLALDFITFLADPYNYNSIFEGIYTAPVFKNQVKSISTPQYLENERLIEKHYHSSTAWLRIKGFSQMDAAYILEYMNPDSDMTALECLQKMNEARKARMTY